MLDVFGDSCVVLRRHLSTRQATTPLARSYEFWRGEQSQRDRGQDRWKWSVWIDGRQRR